MSKLKIYDKAKSVYIASQERIRYVFDNFEKVYVSFSGGKDSTVMLHMVMTEAIKRGRTVGVLVIDLEAQYEKTIEHIRETLQVYKDNTEVYWVCLPLSLRNAVSTFEPRWVCWDKSAKDHWVREFPAGENIITEDNNPFNFFIKGMEFEEFIVLFAEWYSKGALTAGCIGIRADESLNRFRTIASKTKETFNGKKYTSRVINKAYNFYPIYDWKTADVWKYHQVNPSHRHNEIYDYMHRAGLSIHEMRLCQPYGDDQRRGLWLYHILEPQTWSKVVARVNGVNSGSLYIQETGSINGYNKITKPEHHTWESFTKLLLSTMPANTKAHFQERFIVFLKGWKSRGYYSGIPDEAPLILENKKWAPSWRRMCKCLLRNDWWCKGLGFSQPRSEAYGKFIELRKEGKLGDRKAVEAKMDKTIFLDGGE